MKRRFSSSIIQLTLWAVALLFIAGCSAKKVELTESGFLSGYSGMVESEEFEGMRIYKNPDVDIGERYSKILIAPVQFKLDPTLKEHEMDYEDRRKISDYFHDRLIEGLIENEYEITEEPGIDVLLFRAAITDVKPNKVYMNLHWSTTLIGGGIGGASLEGEFVDSITNERILSFVDAQHGKTFLKEPSHAIKNYKSGLSKWGHTQQVVGRWADIMVTNLDRLRAKYEYTSSETYSDTYSDPYSETYTESYSDTYSETHPDSY